MSLSSQTIKDYIKKIPSDLKKLEVRHADNRKFHIISQLEKLYVYLDQHETDLGLDPLKKITVNRYFENNSIVTVDEIKTFRSDLKKYVEPDSGISLKSLESFQINNIKVQLSELRSLLHTLFYNEYEVYSCGDHVFKFFDRILKLCPPIFAEIGGYIGSNIIEEAEKEIRKELLKPIYGEKTFDEFIEKLNNYKDEDLTDELKKIKSCAEWKSIGIGSGAVTALPIVFTEFIRCFIMEFYKEKDCGKALKKIPSILFQAIKTAMIWTVPSVAVSKLGLGWGNVAFAGAFLAVKYIADIIKFFKTTNIDNPFEDLKQYEIDKDLYHSQD